MLKEEETLQKGSVDESDEGTNLGEHSASLEDKNNGLGPQIETGPLQVLEPSENIDLLQQENIKLETESQAEVIEGKKLSGETEDSQKVLYLEKKKQVLKTEFPAFLRNNDGSEKMVSNMENTGTKGGSELNDYSKKYTSAEQQVQYALLSRQNERSLQKECSSSSEHNNFQEGNFMLRSYDSAMQEQTESLAGKTHNLLMEEENARNQLSRKSSSMQEQEHKAELIQVLKKQVKDLELALQESQHENARLTNKYGRRIEENDVANTRSKTLEAELVCRQKENQKLRKELSAKATDFKNLQVMFYSLAKEKEVMARELALKVRILADMEEHLSDLKERDKMLSNKLQAYDRELKSKTRTMQGTITLLQNRNKLLAEQLLKSSEGCRTLKRKLKELQEDNRELKREIGNLKSSIQKQDQSMRVLQSERTALQKDLTSGKKQLHTLQEKFKCLIEETNSDKKQIEYMDREESLNGEIVLLEQLLLHVKEEITCFKSEIDRRDKERQKLKEEIVQLQTEMSCLHAENNALRNGGPSDKIEKKLNADNFQKEKSVSRNRIYAADDQIKSMEKESKQLKTGLQEMAQENEKGMLVLNKSVHTLNMCREDEGAKRKIVGIDRKSLLLQGRNTNLNGQVLSRENSIRSLKGAPDMPFCEKGNHQVEVSQNRDRACQTSNKSSMIQKHDDGVSSKELGKKVIGFEIRSLVNQIKNLYRAIKDLQLSRQYSSATLLSGQGNIHGLEVKVKDLGKLSSNLQKEREILETYDEDLNKQIVFSEQLLKEIEEHISSVVYKRNDLVLDTSNKAVSNSDLEKQLASSQNEIAAKADDNLCIGFDKQEEKKRTDSEQQDRVEWVTQLEDRIRGLQKESDDPKQENMNLKAECEKTRENCSSLEKSLQHLQEELNKANENVKLVEKGQLGLQEENSWVKGSIS